MKKIFISLGSVAALSLPVFVFAEGPALDGYLGTLIKQAGNLLNSLLILLIALAVVWFIWNVIRYSMSEDEGGKELAKNQMIHGIIAIAVIVSVWGIVALLRTAFGVKDNATAPQQLEGMIPGGQTQYNQQGGDAYMPGIIDYRQVRDSYQNNYIQQNIDTNNGRMVEDGISS